MPNLSSDSSRGYYRYISSTVHSALESNSTEYHQVSVHVDEAIPPPQSPGAPSGVNASVGTDGSVTLTWDLLPPGTVTAYIILGAITGEGSRSAITGRLPAEQTWHTIPWKQLMGGAEYRFQVAAVNREAKGPPSLPSETVVVPCQPSAILVTVPKSRGPRDTICVQMPNGQTIKTQIPASHGPGAKFIVSISPDAFD